MAIELTQNAVNHVQKFIQKDTESEYLRLAVKPTGCSGFMYEVTTTGEKIANDCVFNSGGITIVVDEQSLKYLTGSKIDFTEEGLNKGFKFNNPNVAATCGCGESFTIEAD
tara:strand:+ start:3737 stop:4069 length:333 start_codon:yes stop_codon:yes gene_type:complete